MVRYTVVIKDDLQELLNGVNEAIEKGYYPKGGIIYVKDKFIQTIFLREEKPQ